MKWKSPKGEGSVTLGKVLGKGGEGSVYELESIDGYPPSSLVAKIYHEPEGRSGKLVEMIKHPVKSSEIAWPVALLVEEGMFKGYLMPRLDYNIYRPWSEVAHASTRRSNASSFDFRYALQASANLARLLSLVHNAGHVVGDLNESNLLVGVDAKVSLVDTDSAQIGSYRCLVGKPEYTAPELKGAFSQNWRTYETDLYASAVLIWQILTGGTHPTDGEWIGNGEPPSVTERIRHGAYPAIGSTPGFKQLSRVPSEAIPPRVRAVIAKNLSVNPGDRGSFEEFAEILNKELGQLKECSEVQGHWFSGDSCRWCVRRDNGLNDPWGREQLLLISQESLPPISFESPEEAPIKRRSVVTPSQSVSSQPSQPSGGFPSVPNNPASQGSSSNFPTQTTFLPQAQPPQPPEKIKGKSVLTFSDGTWDVRPPLITLARSNFRLALSCFFSEIPEMIKFWWSTKMPPAPLWTVWVGLLAGLVVAASWGFLSALNAGFLPDLLLQFNPMRILAISSVISSFSTVLVLFSTALYSSIKGRSYVPEKWWKVLMRFLTVSVFYGPLFIFILIGFMLYLLVLLIGAIFKAERR